MESLIFIALFAGICLGMWLGTYYAEKVYKKALEALATKMKISIDGPTPNYSISLLIKEIRQLLKDGK